MTGTSLTLLIVDDSPEDRELYRRYLLRNCESAYMILEATSGQQGLNLWQQHRPDALLLDYRLPDLNGLEFLAQMQSLNQQLYLPVIVVTGQGNEAIAVQVMKAGAQDYLIKEQITPKGLQLAINGAIATVKLQTQLQQCIEREQVVAQITRKIHQTLDLEEILQTTVTEVRQFLQTDRVLVFRLQPDGNGMVMSESVRAEWRSLLSSTIYDPCLAENYLRFTHPESMNQEPTFTGEYFNKYRQGQVTAIADIQDSSIDPCHAELLAQFQVKANLVVPILHDDQFWGLLIAHHCSAPRSWQPVEIDLLKELTTQVSIALRQAELYQQAQDELAERRQVEAALRDSEERFRQLAENIDAVFWLRDVSDNRVSYISSAYERLWGWNREELYKNQQAWVDHIHPDDRESSSRAFHEKAALGQFDQEYRIILDDGRVRWVHDRCFPVQDQTGKIYRFTGIAEDITERKCSEQALQESEERFRTSVENILDCLGIYSAMRNQQGQISDFRIEYVNDAACLTNRMMREQQLGRGLCELLPTHLDSGLFDEYCQVVETGQSLVKENLIYDDEYGQQRLTRAFDIRVAKFGDGFVATWRDITERKQIEASLQQSEERYRTLFESMNEGFCVIEMLFDGQNTPFDYRFVEVNPVFEQYTGLQEAEGKMVSQLIPELESYWFQIYGHVALTGKPVCFENGSDVMNRWFEVSAFRVGQPEHRKVAVLFKDISERKQFERERERLFAQEQAARAEAERANRIKDEFLAVLSHELRSPLNPILGWAKLMQTRKFDPAKTAEALATIERNAKLQTQLIDDLLDVAKILRGKLSMDKAPVDLVFVIESAIDTVSTAALAKSILLHSILPRMGQVLGDAARLQQIIWNLLSNAIKFTPEGGLVNIELSLVTSQVSEVEAESQITQRRERITPYAQVTVSDTGKGINADFLPHIFESFRQEDASTTRKYGGLGLGLAIVQSLVEAHGGTISADSPGEGQGATFTVKLPLLSTESKPGSVDNLPEQEPDLTGIRIITVDDDLDTRELLAAVLTQYGAEVLPLASAAEVLAALYSFQPDVLVSDIGMANIDGYELMRRVRALLQGAKLPALALTAFARQEDRQEAIAAGFQEYMAKPIEPLQLVVALTQLLGTR